ncbi:hypothetical protein BC941DRAFT_413242 [Chlamydoabsidia padenii]|nr:hypothetical protein BC941DRAFT_413242 [Chlamydoabsidia padenii]
MNPFHSNRLHTNEEFDPSVYHPTIPDLRSYLKTNKSAKNPPPKVSRRTSVPTTMCDSPTTTVTPTKPVPRQTPPLTPSLSTTLSRSSSTSTIYRPGQTATVRARAEQAKQRQRQLEEEKKKQAAKSMASRTSLRLKQHATSGIDWDTIKQDRRKTLPGQSS